MRDVAAGSDDVMFARWCALAGSVFMLLGLVAFYTPYPVRSYQHDDCDCGQDHGHGHSHTDDDNNAAAGVTTHRDGSGMRISFQELFVRIEMP